MSAGRAGAGSLQGGAEVQFWQMAHMPMNVIFLSFLTEEEDEDEDNTEPKVGLESDQKDDEENKDTKEGKMECVCVGFLSQHRLLSSIHLV